MTTSLTTSENYKTLLKEYDKNKQGVSMWERTFLEPTKKQYQAEQQAISSAAEYDISSAYANYLKSQRNVLQSAQLGTGFKQELGQEMKGAYETSYAATRQQELSDLSKLSADYYTKLAQEDERLSGIASKLSELETALYEFGGVTDVNRLTTAYGTELENGVTGLGHYVYNEETGRYEQTDKAKAFLQNLLYGPEYVGEKSFQTYLDNIGKSDLWDFYAQNQDLVNELVVGTPAATRRTDDELQEKAKEEERIIDVNKKVKEQAKPYFDIELMGNVTSPGTRTLDLPFGLSTTEARPKEGEEAPVISFDNKKYTIKSDADKWGAAQFNVYFGPEISAFKGKDIMGLFKEGDVVRLPQGLYIIIDKTAYELTEM